MEEKQFKSPLFDATATWNGFSYQGKVGLYVCLKLILDSLNRNEDIDEFCSQYSIEFEWLEDFSILKNNQYKSHHQVKHYNDGKFSSYIDAFVTILSRQQGRISENDLIQYISYYAHASIKGIDKKEYVENLIRKLIDDNIVNEQRCITSNKVSKLNGYHDDVVTAVNYYLNDFESIKSQFLDGYIYVHTSKAITIPEKDLCKYEKIKKSKVCLNESSKITLKNHNILCSFDSNSAYDLALDDEALTKKLMCLSESILKHLINPPINISDDIVTIYLAAIKNEINKYIEHRHEDLKRDKKVRLSEKVKRKLSFTEILRCLRMEIIDESKDYYWELICRENFENAFQKQIDSLDEEDFVERNNLNRHYKTTYDKYIKQGKLGFLLKALKPHLSICDKSSKSNYYQQHIANENDISISFLSFLENLHVEHDDCLLFPKNGKHFRASTISVSNSNPRNAKQAIEILKIDFRNKFIHLDKNTDFIVIDSPNNVEFSSYLEKFVEVPNVLDYEVPGKPPIASPKDITFIHYGLAQEKLNE
ncbi:TPA: hypothetical protein RQK49_004201 [Vibrio vulnificus]|nr:hypothetical protein [Vibrio vulnificus]